METLLLALLMTEFSISNVKIKIIPHFFKIIKFVTATIKQNILSSFSYIFAPEPHTQTSFTIMKAFNHMCPLSCTSKRRPAVTRSVCKSFLLNHLDYWPAYCDILDSQRVRQTRSAERYRIHMITKSAFS